MTHRGEAIVLLSLSVAMFAGAKDPNGAEQMDENKHSSINSVFSLELTDFIQLLNSDKVLQS